MRIIFFIIIIFIFLSFNNIYEGYSSMKNIYGEPLQPCRKIHDDYKGSWDSNGYCSELDGGVHQICFNVVNNSTDNFSKATYQSDWSKSRVEKNHCMCLGAWALYKARQDNHEIPETNNELICDAIPENSLEPHYINKWKTWNGNELPEQIKHGIESLYSQCSDKADNEQKKFLKAKYDNIMSYL